jgi:[ribosomal protein S5]-alanine N-acetyltransferase
MLRGVMPPPPTLVTPRLTLAPLALEDAPAIQRRFPRWEVVEFLAAAVPWPYPADGALRFIEHAREAMARGAAHHWGLRVRGGPDEVVGAIGLWPDAGQRDQRGFWLDPELRGRGYMTEAAERVTEYAFEELGWSSLWLSNAAANVRSARVKERQGAALVEMVVGRYVSGELPRQVWRLDADVWRARRGRGSPQRSEPSADM